MPGHWANRERSDGRKSESEVRLSGSGLEPKTTRTTTATRSSTGRHRSSQLRLTQSLRPRKRLQASPSRDQYVLGSTMLARNEEPPDHNDFRAPDSLEERSVFLRIGPSPLMQLLGPHILRPRRDDSFSRKTRASPNRGRRLHYSEVNAGTSPLSELCTPAGCGRSHRRSRQALRNLVSNM